jgi:hypothetical protein
MKPRKPKKETAKEPKGNLCSRCEKVYTTDSTYWTCDACVIDRYKDAKAISFLLYKLPGNP